MSAQMLAVRGSPLETARGASIPIQTRRSWGGVRRLPLAKTTQIHQVPHNLYDILRLALHGRFLQRHSRFVDFALLRFVGI